MEEDKKIEAAETVEPKSRRAFVKGAAKAAVVAPAVVMLLNATTKEAKTAPFFYGELPSDLRLKQDVCPVETLPNGMQLYSFRYWNDDRTFIGVMAQDLLRHESFRHAVTEDKSGYYVVNLGALGLEISGSKDEFLEAGQNALKAAKPVIN